MEEHVENDEPQVRGRHSQIDRSEEHLKVLSFRDGFATLLNRGHHMLHCDVN